MRLTPLQSLVWRVAVVIEVIAVVATFSQKADIHDPVIGAILLVTVLVLGWLTRRWVASSITEETVRNFRLK